MMKGLHSKIYPKPNVTVNNPIKENNHVQDVIKNDFSMNSQTIQAISTVSKIFGFRIPIIFTEENQKFTSLDYVGLAANAGLLGTIYFKENWPISLRTYFLLIAGGSLLTAMFELIYIKNA